MKIFSLEENKVSLSVLWILLKITKNCTVKMTGNLEYKILEEQKYAFSIIGFLLTAAREVVLGGKS